MANAKELPNSNAYGSLGKLAIYNPLFCCWCKFQRKGRKRAYSFFEFVYHIRLHEGECIKGGKSITVAELTSIIHLLRDIHVLRI